MNRQIMQSDKWSLNEADIKSWATNLVRYVLIPTGIVFAGAYTLHYDVKYAIGAAIVTLFNSLQNLFNKWQGGN